MWLWRHCRRRAIYWLLRSPSQTCHAKPKTQINGRGRYQLLSRWWDACRKQLGLKDFSPKKSDAGMHGWGVALYYDWSWWYPSGNRPLQQYLGFTAGRWLWSVRTGQPAWLQNSKRAGTVREIDVWAESPRLSRSPDYLHIVCPVMSC